MSEGWYCPGCSTYHAPDVKTCPGVKPVEYPSEPFKPWEPLPMYDPHSDSTDTNLDTNWILWN